MAFVDPQTISNPTAGQPAAAAWGDTIRDDLMYLATNKPHARVGYTAAAFAVVTATWTAVTFDTETTTGANNFYDVGGCHAAADSKLIVPTGEGGKYLIGAQVQWATNATGRRLSAIRVNGAASGADGWHGQVEHAVVGAGEAGGIVVTELNLAAGDYVQLMVYQSSGGNLNLLVSNKIYPTLWWRWVATS